MPILRASLPWLLSLYIAFVFIQSLFFKFSDSEESIFIFQTVEDWLGLPFFEPFMRNFIGGSELLCSFLLFLPVTRPLGALGAIAIISGAFVFHVFSPLGIEVKGDGGTLFILACGVWVAAAVILYLERPTITGLLTNLGFRTVTPA